MITQLTHNQKLELNNYYNKWLSIGKDCTPININKLYLDIDNLYRELGYAPPIKLIFENPFHCLIAKFIFDSQIRSQIDSQIRSQIALQIDSQIHSQIDPQIDLQIYSQIALQIDSQIHSQIRSQIDSQIGSQIDLQIKNNGWLYGQHNASWVGYYDFYHKIFNFKTKNEKLFDIIIDITQNSHWFLPMQNICFMSERPLYISINNSNQLHCDGDMAIKYKNWGVYALNNILVTKDIAETPAEKLNPELILKEQNMNIQREIIKKIGIERVLKKLKSKCLDKWTLQLNGKKFDYQLLELKANNLNRKYMYYESAMLKGYFYAMPVPPEVKTAKQGFVWFKRILERNDITNITENVLDDKIRNIKWLC